MKYVQCFKDFQQIVKSCFSHELHKIVEENVHKFGSSCPALTISVTKVHAVFFHVSHFCRKHSKGLAFFSEQAVEAAHHDFNVTWKKYEVATGHPMYGPKC